MPSYHDLVLHALRFCKVSEGDLIFSQSSMIPFLLQAKKKDRKLLTKEFCDALFHAVGKQGTVCFPVFSYSGFNNEVYDPTAPPDKTMGLLPEIMWETRECYRTRDPNFSVAACGRLAEEMTRDVPHTSFGKNSFFDRFFKRNGRLVQIGVSVDGTTLVIYFDQKLRSPYRFLKRFPAQSLVEGHIVNSTWTVCVRKDMDTVKTDLASFRNRTENEGILETVNFMGASITSVRIQDLYLAVKRYLREDPLFFIKH